MNFPTIPGLDLPIRSIFCIGRNYTNHVKEMNAELPSEPLVFLKPLSSIAFDGDTIELPSQSDDVHHEVEMVIAIGKPGKNISKTEAFSHISGFGIGIDFTARDLQKVAKQKGTPWSVAKGFDGFAPISEFVPIETEEELNRLEIQLSVNGQTKQSGAIKDMIFNIPSLISYLSSIFTLNEGDLILTGTPEGVSAVRSGDKVTARFTNHTPSLTVHLQ